MAASISQHHPIDVVCMRPETPLHVFVCRHIGRRLRCGSCCRSQRHTRPAACAAARSAQVLLPLHLITMPTLWRHPTKDCVAPVLKVFAGAPGLASLLVFASPAGASLVSLHADDSPALARANLVGAMRGVLAPFGFGRRFNSSAFARDGPPSVYCSDYDGVVPAHWQTFLRRQAREAREGPEPDSLRAAEYLHCMDTSRVPLKAIALLVQVYWPEMPCQAFRLGRNSFLLAACMLSPVALSAATGRARYEGAITMPIWQASRRRAGSPAGLSTCRRGVLRLPHGGAVRWSPICRFAGNFRAGLAGDWRVTWPVASKCRAGLCGQEYGRALQCPKDHESLP